MGFIENFFKGGGNGENKESDSHGFVAVPKSGGESLPNEEHKELDLKDHTKDVIRRIKEGEGDQSFLRNKLENLKEQLKKEIERLEKDLEKENGNSGFWEAEREELEDLNRTLKEAEKIS